MKIPPLAILALTYFIDMLGFGLILPLIPVYIEHYNGQPWVGGALLASFSVTQFVFAPIGGRWSDRIGRRPVILISLIGSALSYLTFGLAPNLLILFLARLAAGALTAPSLPTAQAYIADITPPEKRAGGMAILGMAFGVGFAFGPVIGGWLSSFSILGQPALATPSIFAAVLAGVAFLCAWLLLPESLQQSDRVESQRVEMGLGDLLPSLVRAVRHPTVGAQLTVFAFYTFAFTAVESSFSWLVLLRFRDTILHRTQVAYEQAHPGLQFVDLDPEIQRQLIEKMQAGTTTGIFTVVGVTIFFVQLAVVRGLAARVGEIWLVRAGALLLTLALIGIAFAPNLQILYVTSVMIAAGSGIMNPSLTALITQAAPPHERGSLSGIQQGLGSLARMVAPPINNGLVGVNTAIPFLASAVMMGTAFVLGMGLRPSTPEANPISNEEQTEPGH